MYRFLLAPLAAVSLFALQPGPAKAEVDVDIRIGTPGYYDGGYDYDRRPSYRYRDRYSRRGHGKLSCAQAKRIVRRSGFRDVAARDCSGKTYSFNATRHGQRMRVYVDARSGAVWRG